MEQAGAKGGKRQQTEGHGASTKCLQTAPFIYTQSRPGAHGKSEVAPPSPVVRRGSISSSLSPHQLALRPEEHGAFRSRAVADQGNGAQSSTRGKTEDPCRPPHSLATSCDKERMVGRRSTVRVRERASRIACLWRLSAQSETCRSCRLLGYGAFSGALRTVCVPWAISGRERVGRVDW